MQIPPPVRYAERDGGRIAFQVFGNGTGDFITISDPPSHLDFLWTDSDYVEVLLRTANARRSIVFDRRGTGLSDPLEVAPTLEGQAQDLESVMNAAESESAVIFGYGGSASVAAYYAATRPERADRLILLTPWDRDWMRNDDAWTADKRRATLARLTEALDDWGSGRMLSFAAPALDNPRNRRTFAMLERASATRAQARASMGFATRLDLSAFLPSIRVPTLVVDHEDFPVPEAVVSRVADQVPGATFLQLGYQGTPRNMGDLWLPILDAINTWLDGDADHVDGSRVVVTLLFTDIVGSTSLAARLGDAEWRSLLVRHDGVLSDLVDRSGGRLIKNIGDGSLSAFDGPVQAVTCADQLRQAVQPMGLELRAGIHTGECERLGLDVAGMAVHVGARVEAQAEPGEILITRPSRDLCHGSGLQFAPQGGTVLRDVPGTWELFSVAGAGRRDEVSAAARRLRPADRAVLALARRAPRVLRAAGRLRGRGKT